MNEQDYSRLHKSISLEQVSDDARELQKKLNDGHCLTIQDLADVFGAERVWPLFGPAPANPTPPPVMREACRSCRGIGGRATIGCPDCKGTGYEKPGPFGCPECDRPSVCAVIQPGTRPCDLHPGPIGPIPNIAADTLKRDSDTVQAALHHFDQAANTTSPLAGALGQSAAAQQLKTPRPRTAIVLVMAKDVDAFMDIAARLRMVELFPQEAPVYFLSNALDLVTIRELERADDMYVIVTTSATENMDYFHRTINSVNVRARTMTTQRWELIDIRHGVHRIALPTPAAVFPADVLAEQRLHADGRAVYDMIRGTSRRGFVRDVAAVINKSSRENRSGTADWILAEFLEDVLTAFETAVKKRHPLQSRGGAAGPGLDRVI